MRSFSVALMVLSAVMVILTGIGESSSSHAGLPSHHIAAAALLLAAVCIHGWYNRKAMTKYFSGLGWKWAAVAGSLLVAVVVGTIFR